MVQHSLAQHLVRRPLALERAVAPRPQNALALGLRQRREAPRRPRRVLPRGEEPEDVPNLGLARMPLERADELLGHARLARGRQTVEARARTCRRSRRAQPAAGARAPSRAYANAVARVELELVGAGGEPVDFWRTVNSHGLNDLVPNRIDSVERTLELTLYPGPQTVLVRKAGPDQRDRRGPGAAPRRRRRAPRPAAGRGPLAALREARGGPRALVGVAAARAAGCGASRSSRTS